MDSMTTTRISINFKDSSLGYLLACLHERDSLRYYFKKNHALKKTTSLRMLLIVMHARLTLSNIVKLISFMVMGRKSPSNNIVCQGQALVRAPSRL